MAPRKRSEEENMRRAKIRELLNVAHVASIEEIQMLFRETIAEFIEKALEAELEELLGCSRHDPQAKQKGNSRNGYTYKTLRTSFGDVVVAVPRDRKGIFTPKLVAKNQAGVTRDIEEKIFSMYAKGMTTSAIEEHLRDIYGISVSASTVSRITDKVIPSLKQWLERPLEKIYAIVFMDALKFHVRKNGQTQMRPYI